MGGVSNRVNRANWPVLWPQLYQIDRTSTPRYTIMKPSKIPRIYHHTSGLTRDGTVLMSGCDACDGRFFNSTMPDSQYDALRTRVRSSGAALSNGSCLCGTPSGCACKQTN
jgi:hypothetical protein